jgi:hypothetical protein
VHVIPARKHDQPASQPAADGAQRESQLYGQHVQHEYGLLHPGGEHAQHSKQRQPRAGPCANGTPNVHKAAAGAVATGDEDGAPNSKRVRRSGDSSVPGQSDVRASLSAMQVAAVQQVQDAKAFKACAAQYGVYTTVQPQLAQDSCL